MRTNPPATIQKRAQDYYNAVFDKELLHLMDVADGEKKPTRREIADYGQQMSQYPEDTAREAIEQRGYGMDKAVIYYVTLAGGGPAARLRVEVEDGEVIGASFQFCDWFEPWTDAPNQDRALVERYARLIAYYGE
jgi:hypothetical protein